MMERIPIVVFAETIKQSRKPTAFFLLVPISNQVEGQPTAAGSSNVHASSGRPAAARFTGWVPLDSCVYF